MAATDDNAEIKRLKAKLSRGQRDPRRSHASPSPSDRPHHRSSSRSSSESEARTSRSRRPATCSSSTAARCLHCPAGTGDGPVAGGDHNLDRLVHRRRVARLIAPLKAAGLLTGCCATRSGRDRSSRRTVHRQGSPSAAGPDPHRLRHACPAHATVRSQTLGRFRSVS